MIIVIFHTGFKALESKSKAWISATTEILYNLNGISQFLES